MISPSELVTKIRTYHPNLDEALIKKAYLFAKASHGSQKRHSGETYFSHPLAVAEILSDLKLDQASIVTALLHDVVEDTEVTSEEIEKNFGEEIRNLVDGVTKLGKIKSLSSSERAAENFRKLALAMSEDIRVLLIKLADRLHNMRTLFYVPSKEKKLTKAQESLDVYAPLAGRIGLSKIQDELQNLCFEIIDNETYKQIVEHLNELREKNKNLINKILNDLKLLLIENEKIECEVSGREKKPYSIYQKMREKNTGFHNLHDIIAFRITCKDLGECYRIMGIINSNYNMIPGSFKDYISTPKDNGYQSLHLTILGPFNKKIEIQIRDQKMHEVADLGIAAHWRYKEKSTTKSKISKTESEKYNWIRDLVNLFEASENASDVLKDYKFNMHQNEVFCFTPNGDIFNLPFGATVIDFAYAIHSDIGNSCISAKINGVITPLRQKIENGDQVEIITQKNIKPSPNWLQFVTTTKARAAIKNFIRHEKFEEYSALGRAILNKFFATKNLEISDKILEKTLTFFHRKTVADLCFKVAEGVISRQEILKAIYPDFKEETKDKASKQGLDSRDRSDYKLPIEGLLAGMATYYPKCCNPIPGDPIVGVIHTGSGVTIHNQNCKILKNLVLTPQRILNISWRQSEEIKDEKYLSKIRVTLTNKSGSLADVSSLITKKDVRISNIKVANRVADYLELLVDVEVKSVDHLEEILSSLRSSKKIIEAERVF
jgi:GTP diphosphokinase / guanosine-3',5'-bis(diphosphate) 3'-diphosphatase